MKAYVGHARIDSTRYRGSKLRPRQLAAYAFPAALARDQLSLAGNWTIGDQRAVAGTAARLRLHYHAHDVYLVLGGHGHVVVSAAGQAARTVSVNGDRLYTLLTSPTLHDGPPRAPIQPRCQRVRRASSAPGTRTSAAPGRLLLLLLLLPLLLLPLHHHHRLRVRREG